MEDDKSEKTIWTEEDFKSMQWHDCKIYAHDKVPPGIRRINLEVHLTE